MLLGDVDVPQAAVEATRAIRCAATSGGIHERGGLHRVLGRLRCRQSGDGQ